MRSSKVDSENRQQNGPGQELEGKRKWTENGGKMITELWFCKMKKFWRSVAHHCELT